MNKELHEAAQKLIRCCDLVTSAAYGAGDPDDMSCEERKNTIEDFLSYARGLATATRELQRRIDQDYLAFYTAQQSARKGGAHV